jgi:hypothetical protein
MASVAEPRNPEIGKAHPAISIDAAEPQRGLGIPPQARRESQSFPHIEAIGAWLFRLMLVRILALLDENDNAISRPKLRQFAAILRSTSPRKCRQGGRQFHARFINRQRAAIFTW